MQRKNLLYCLSLISGLRPIRLMQIFGVLAIASLASAQIRITSISPASGPLAGGNVVRLLGSGFTSNTSVWVWANQAPIVTFVSTSEIDVRIPARSIAGAVDVAAFASSTDSARISGGYTYATGSGSTSTTGATTPSTSFPAMGKSLSACADLTAQGSYYLTANVSATGTCFFIDANNISLNLNGHTVTYGTGGGTEPTPGVLLADPWYRGYGIARTGSTGNHSNFELYNGSIVEAPAGAAKSPAIWVGQSNSILPAPRIHDLTLITYTTDASPIFGTVSEAGWQIYNNKIYYSAKATTSRVSFLGYAIWLGDQEQAPGLLPDLIHNNYIYAAPQGGIRDTHQNAKIYSNDIAFNSTYTNDFCVDAPANGQLVTLNHCHPASGRGVHVNAHNVTVLSNTIAVQELPQNTEYGGCELGGAFGIQVEFDTSFTVIPPTGVLISGNQVTATAGACNAIGVRATSMTSAGSMELLANKIVTTNSGSTGRDYGLSFSDVNAPGVPFSYVGNSIQSKHAFVGIDWDGANTFIPAGQLWVGTPVYAVDDENGFKDPSEGGPIFSQALTVQDAMPGVIHCGPYASGPVKSGSISVQCN